MEPGEPFMPADSLAITVGIVVAFAVFAVVLAWGGYRTQKPQD
jgi:hypothetical protein